jgi:pyruvate/2-oxoglutarate/acetoin dehydrogenase E1 component
MKSLGQRFESFRPHPLNQYRPAADFRWRTGGILALDITSAVPRNGPRDHGRRHSAELGTTWCSMPGPE